jgi:hypothetical protein
MRLSWNHLERAPWEAFHARHGGALQQSWAYGEALRSLGVGVQRACIEDGGELLGLAQFICRRVALYLGLSSCTRGPVWSAQAPAGLRRQALRELQRGMPVRPLRVTLFSPDASAQALLAGELGRLTRVLTGYSTVMLDLRRPLAELRAELDGKWRNRLAKAEADPQLRVQLQADRQALQELLRREDEQRAHRGFHGLPTELVPAFIDAHDRPSQAYVMSTARQGKELLASMLFLLHGRGATYHMGWSNEAGRKLNVHNLLLWRAMERLQQQGFEQLDLGGVNTRDLPGISRFKLGTGGRVLTLAGTYF